MWPWVNNMILFKISVFHILCVFKVQKNTQWLAMCTDCPKKKFTMHPLMIYLRTEVHYAATVTVLNSYERALHALIVSSAMVQGGSRLFDEVEPVVGEVNSHCLGSLVDVRQEV